MAFLNLSTKNSNRGRENYLALIRSRSVNKFLFSVTYEAIESQTCYRTNLLSCVEIGDKVYLQSIPLNPTRNYPSITIARLLLRKVSSKWVQGQPLGIDRK